MGIVKWNPNQVNRVFDDFFKNTAPTANRPAFRGTIPAVNVKENDDQFELELAAPGLSKEDFKIEINDGILAISAEHQAKEEQTTEGYTRKEFSFSSFTRRFTLPEDANDKDIAANYENGVLKVVIPKKEEAKPQPARLIAVA